MEKKNTLKYRMMTRKHCWCILFVPNIILNHWRQRSEAETEEHPWWRVQCLLFSGKSDSRVSIDSGSLSDEICQHQWHLKKRNIFNLYNKESDQIVQSWQVIQLLFVSYLVRFSVGLCYCIHHRRCCRHLGHDIPLWCWIRTMTILTFLRSLRKVAILERVLSRFLSLSHNALWFTLGHISRRRRGRTRRLLVLSRDPFIGVSSNLSFTLFLTL